MKSLLDQYEEAFCCPGSKIDLSRFSDVGIQGTFTYDSIDDLTNRIPLFKGEGDGTRFGSEDVLSRAVVAEVLLRLAELGQLEGYEIDDNVSGELFDVPEGAWFERSFKIAVRNGIFQYNGGYVRPTDPVIWSEIVTILRRFLDLEMIQPNSSYWPFGLQWYDSEFFPLFELGILTEYPEHPADEARKIDLVKMLAKAIGRGNIFSILPAGDLEKTSCEDIQDLVNYEKCRYKLAVVFSEPSFCQNLSQADSCWRKMALIHSDDSYCSEIESLSNKSNCIVLLSNHSDSESICSQIQITYQRNQCYWDSAEAKKDVKLCELISGDDENQASCFRNVAQKTGDGQYCSRGNDVYTQDACFRIVAEMNAEIEWCDNVSEANERDFCRLQVINAVSDSSLCSRMETDDWRVGVCKQ